MQYKKLQWLAQVAHAYLKQALIARTGLSTYAMLATHDSHSLQKKKDNILLTHHFLCIVSNCNVFAWSGVFQGINSQATAMAHTPRMQCLASFRRQSELHVGSFWHRAQGSIVERWASVRAVNRLVDTGGGLGGSASSITP